MFLQKAHFGRVCEPLQAKAACSSRRYSTGKFEFLQHCPHPLSPDRQTRLAIAAVLNFPHASTGFQRPTAGRAWSGCFSSISCLIKICLTSFCLTSFCLAAQNSVQSRPQNAAQNTPQSTAQNDAPASADEALTPTETEQRRADLRSHWAGYQSEVVSADIRYQAVGFSINTVQKTLEEILAELEQVPMTSPDRLAEDLMQRYCPERLPAAGSTGTQTLRSSARRLQFQDRNRRCTTPSFEHVLTDDLHLLADKDNTGITAWRRGMCPIWFESPEWFRVIPNDDLLNAVQHMARSPAPRSESGTASNTWLRLDHFNSAETARDGGFPSRLYLDPADRLPRRWELVSAQSGTVRRVELYRNYADFPGNVRYARERIEIDFRQGFASAMQVTVIEQARFNLAVPAETFRLQAAEKWRWFDHQEEDQESGVWPQPIEDVATFFRQRQRGTMAETSSPTPPRLSGSWRSLLLLLNGGILIIAGVTFWRRSL